MIIEHLVRGRQELPGRDRKAARHAATPGRTRDDAGHRVIVIGGGIAGLSAATALAERGVRVTVVEREHQLGGRVRAWPVQVGAAETTMSRGFHAFFRQYYNLRGLLRRTDPGLDRLRPVRDYPLVAASGHRDSFAHLPKLPPFNMAAFVLRSKTFPVRDLIRIDPDAARELIDVDFPATFDCYDGESASAFLDRLRFPDQARHLALEIFARSFFADPDEFSAAELIAMFHAYFVGSSEGLLFDVPDDDYDTSLWAPLGHYLRQLGVELRTGETVTAMQSGADGVQVHTGSGALHADAVVIATDVATTRALATADGAVRADAAWRTRLQAMSTAPPFAVRRLWVDRPAAPGRPPFLATAGYGLVDNVSVVERFEAGATRWTQQTGGSVVELHAYALPPGTSDDAVRARMREVLHEIYPEYRDAEVVGEQYLRNQDCPLVGIEPWSSRPEVGTPDPRVVLAGDGIRCDWPVALMERAATTGFLAANRLLADWGVAGHELWTVPTRSRYPIRRLPRRATARV